MHDLHHGLLSATVNCVRHGLSAALLLAADVSNHVDSGTTLSLACIATEHRLHAEMLKLKPENVTPCCHGHLCPLKCYTVPIAKLW